jgi:hypothetical protein
MAGMQLQLHSCVMSRCCRDLTVVRARSPPPATPPPRAGGLHSGPCTAQSRPLTLLGSSTINRPPPTRDCFCALFPIRHTLPPHAPGSVRGRPRVLPPRGAPGACVPVAGLQRCGPGQPHAGGAGREGEGGRGGRRGMGEGGGGGRRGREEGEGGGGGCRVVRMLGCRRGAGSE